MSNRELIFRIVSKVYFPAQFFAVWVLYFGFVLEPGILTIAAAFNVDGIVIAALRFAAILPFKFFTAQKLIHFLILMLPYLLLLLLSLWRIALFLFVTWQLVQFLIAEISCFAYRSQSLNDSACVVVKIGGPGSGKSSSAIFDALLKADKMWAKLKYLYWLYKGRVDEWQSKGNVSKIQEWYEIRDAYEFYAATDCIPCLWSNIPLESLYGQRSNALTAEHLYQNKRLPAFSVLFVDEIGSMIDVELYRKRPFNLSNMFRFCRHFGQFIIIATEQSAENLFIDARRVVAYNMYMLSQTWVCKPYPLLLVYNLVKRIVSCFERLSKPLSGFMSAFDSLIRHIGYRRYRYCYEGNTERTQSLYSGGRRTFYLPSTLNGYYDDRTYREFYLAKDQPVASDVFPSLKLAKERDGQQQYLRLAEREELEEAERRRQVIQLIDELFFNSLTSKTAIDLGKTYDTRSKLLKSALNDDSLLAALLATYNALAPPQGSETVKNGKPHT